MICLTLTRHGQTTENQEGILQGQSPGHLNQTGMEQAQQLAAKLNAEDYDLIICSDLERTRLTAEIINKRLCLPIEYTPLLRERDWGEYTGLYIRDIIMPPSKFPPSVENATQLGERAKHFLEFLLEKHDNKRLLAVGHGYFNRCVQAFIEQKSVRKTPRWENTELRIFNITPKTATHNAPTDFIVSEN